jgi:hypothetical protein
MVNSNIPNPNSYLAFLSSRPLRIILFSLGILLVSPIAIIQIPKYSNLISLSWVITAYFTGIVLQILSAFSSEFFKSFVDKKLEHAESKLKELNFLLPLVPLLGKVEFQKNSQNEVQFSHIIDQMRTKIRIRIGILNYTNTSTYNYFAQHLSNLIHRALSVKHQIEYSCDFVSLKYFVDWVKIIEALKINRSPKAMSTPEVDVNKLREWVCLSPAVIDKETKDIVKSPRSQTPTQFAYVIQETFRLIQPYDTVTRMYYLDSKKISIPSEINHLKERFLFACASIMNCLFSDKYSIAILPARLEPPYWKHEGQYTVVYGVKKQNSLSEPEPDNPPIWVLSYLGKPDTDNVDYMFIQCLENEEDSIIGSKCSHITSNLENIWRELEINNMVLFHKQNGSALSTLYMKRICKIGHCIHARLTGQDQTDFKNAVSKFKEIATSLKSNHGLQIDIDNKADICGPADIWSEIWNKKEINNFQTISTGSLDCTKCWLGTPC